MKSGLGILHLEDDSSDAELVQDTLAADGIICQVTRVETRADFIVSLERGGCDLILADYTLPSFDGLEALKIARDRWAHLPFIFVSGTLDEEVAIEALKIGAKDYVFKTGLSRLVPSVRRALHEAEERAELGRAEAALRRSEAYLAEAQRLSHTGSFGWDVGTGKIYWSRETFRIFDYEPASTMTIDHVLKRTHPDDTPVVLQVIERASRERKEFDFEHRLLMPDGSIKYLHVVGHPAIDDSGNIEFVGAVTDITERNEALEEIKQRTHELAAANDELKKEVAERWRAEDALRESERESRLIVDSIPGLVAMFTPGGEVELVNRQILEYFGMTLEELKSWGTGSTTHPEDLPRVVELFTHSIASGDPFEFEVRARRFDGVYRWFQSRGFPLQDTNGHIVRWYNLLIDIDERKRAEEALRESERESRLIVDTIPGLVAIMTPAGEVDVVNNQIVEYCGQPLEEMKQWGTNGTVYSEDLPRVIQVFTEAITSGDPYDFEARIRRFDGVYRWFQVRGLPLRDTSGHIARWYVLLSDIDDRKRAEDAVRASERNLKLITDTIPALAWSARPDGSTEFFNRHYLDFIGLSAEQASGWGWTAAVHPDDLNGLAAAWQRIMASEEPGESEARLRRHDGEYRWFLFRANPLHDKSGNIVKWYGINTDIEDLKRAEDKARLIIDTALDAVVAMDAQGTITSWNKQAEAVFGWSHAEAIGQRMSDMIIPAQQRMAHERGLRHFLDTGEGPILRRRIEVTAVRRSGVEFPVELEVMPVKLGQEWVFSAFIRDITDSRLAHDKLRESELNLRQMTETIPEMLWSATPEGAVDYCNGRLLDYTGFSAEEVIGNVWTTLLHPDDVDRAARVWRSCVTTGAPYRVEVRTFHAADHSYRWCVTNARPLQDDQGRILKWHGTVVDMHDWKQAQEELRNTQEKLAQMTRVMTMGELTASIAHEVNQPLSGIITNASTCLRMLGTDPPDVDGARETARRTIRDGNRASDVITRLRALFSKKEFTLELLDLNEATREVIALSLSELQRNRVIVRSELADDLPNVAGDRIQLQQVILNLVRNASDAMVTVHDRPRQLLIRTEREDGDRVRLAVRDAGVGLDRQSMHKLFDAFFTTKSDGMGIGLSVSRSIVERHHGRLWAEPNDGPGATFSLSIPRGPESVTDARGGGQY